MPPASASAPTDPAFTPATPSSCPRQSKPSATGALPPISILSLRTPGSTTLYLDAGLQGSGATTPIAGRFSLADLEAANLEKQRAAARFNGAATSFYEEEEPSSPWMRARERYLRSVTVSLVSHEKYDCAGSNAAFSSFAEPSAAFGSMQPGAGNRRFNCLSNADIGMEKIANGTCAQIFVAKRYVICARFPGHRFDLKYIVAKGADGIAHLSSATQAGREATFVVFTFCSRSSYVLGYVHADLAICAHTIRGR